MAQAGPEIIMFLYFARQDAGHKETGQHIKHEHSRITFEVACHKPPPAVQGLQIKEMGYAHQQNGIAANAVAPGITHI
jgi:hypothetical protein